MSKRRDTIQMRAHHCLLLVSRLNSKYRVLVHFQLQSAQYRVYTVLIERYALVVLASTNHFDVSVRLQCLE